MIIDHLFGEKYYFVALKLKIDNVSPHRCILSSYIFRSKDDAEHYITTSVSLNATYDEVGIYSFRSKTPLPGDYVRNRSHLDFSKFNN